MVDTKRDRARVVLATRDDIRFSWSPRGARLAASADSLLYVGSPRSTLRSIGRGCLGAWSPHGKRLAFVSDGWAFTVDPDGSRKRRLVRAIAVEDWSNDGKRLALLRRLKGSCRGTEPERLYVYRFKDGRLRKVTNDRRVIYGEERERGGQRNASFSPDGRFLAFAEGRPCPMGSVPEYEPHVLVAPSGKEVGRGRPSWSPSSRLLAVRLLWGSSSDRPPLVIVTPTGNQVIVVHKSYSFDWSPDGSRLAFARVDGDRPESYRLENNVYVLRIADLEPVRLVAGGDRPYWSPDGSAVAFERPLSAAPSPGCWTELRLVTVRTGRQAKLLGC